MILRARIISFAFDYVRNKKQLKDLASEMGIDPASLKRTMYGNARLNRNDTVEGYTKIKGKIYQFHSKEELNKILYGE